MVGEARGFLRQKPAIESTHRSTHREALVIKNLTKELSEKMNDCIHIVNFVNARASNSRIFHCYAKKWDQLTDQTPFNSNLAPFHSKIKS